MRSPKKPDNPPRNRRRSSRLLQAAVRFFRLHRQSAPTAPHPAHFDLERMEPRLLLSSIVWANTGSAWNVASDWVGGVVPTASDIAVFPDATKVIDPKLTANAAVKGITINNSGADYSITGSKNLTIGSSGISVTTPSSTTADKTTISDNIILSANQTWTVTNHTGATQLIATGVVSGAKNLAKAGSGTLLFTATDTYTGTTITAGTLQLGNGGAAGSITGSSAIIDNASLILDADAAVSPVYRSIISGSGSLTDEAKIVTILDGTNTYTGTTTIDPGATLKLGQGESTPGIADSSQIIDNGALLFEFTGDITYAHLITGSGSLTMGFNNVVGTLILTANDTYTGPTTIAFGTLQLGSGGTSGALSSATTITDDAMLTYDRSNTATAANSISGSGGFTNLGTGDIILTANDTFTGPTTISAGTLQLGSGGTTGNITSTSTITDNAQLAFDQSANLTFALPITGSGSLTDQAQVVTVLNGANTYTGITTIDPGATLKIGQGGSTPSIADSSKIIDNGALLLEFTGAMTYAHPITGSGSLTMEYNSVVGTLILTANESYTGPTTIAFGTLQIGDGGDTGSLSSATTITDNSLLTYDLAGTVTLPSIITGPGGFTNLGDGTLILTANNTYSGTTTITAGTLQLGNGGTTGSLGSGPVTDNSTLAVDQAGNVSLLNLITGTGNLTMSGGGNLTLGSADTFTGGVTILSGTVTRETFTVFNNLGFSGMPNLQPDGLANATLISPSNIWPSSDTTALYNTSGGIYADLPNQATFEAMVQSQVLSHGGSLTAPSAIVLDIETLSLGETGTAAQVEQNFTVLTTLAQWAEQADPKAVVGYYTTTGYGDMPSPYTAAYQSEANTLAAAQDAFFPSMYTRTTSEASWLTEAQTQIAQAHALAPGKPIYFYLWPQLYDTTTFLAGSQWTYELQQSQSLGLAGVVLWAPNNVTPWSTAVASAWWPATLSFMAGIPSPIIDSLTLSAASVSPGTPVTLTATSVADAGAPITTVAIYEESNTTPGLELPGDTYIGSAVNNNGNWSLTLSTTTLPPGAYTFYAVATDADGISTPLGADASSISLTVT